MHWKINLLLYFLWQKLKYLMSVTSTTDPTKSKHLVHTHPFPRQHGHRPLATSHFISTTVVALWWCLAACLYGWPQLATTTIAKVAVAVDVHVMIPCVSDRHLLPWFMTSRHIVKGVISFPSGISIKSTRCEAAELHGPLAQCFENLKVLERRKYTKIL